MGHFPRTPGKGIGVEPFLKEFYTEDCKGNKITPEERVQHRLESQKLRIVVKRRPTKEVSTVSRNYNWGVPQQWESDKSRKAKKLNFQHAFIAN